MELAESAEPRLMGPEQAAWFARLDLEDDNLRAALSLALDQGDAALPARMGGAFRRFWNLRGHSEEGRRWLERSLALGDTAGVASALGNLGLVAQACGSSRQAIAVIEKSLALFRALGDQSQIANQFEILGLAVYEQGDYDRAAGNQQIAAFALNNLARVAHALGDSAFILAREEGKAMTMDSAIAVALRRDCP